MSKIVHRQEGENTLLLVGNDRDLANFKTKIQIPTTEVELKPVRMYQTQSTTQIAPHTAPLPATSRSWFYATELATIYGFPKLASGAGPVIAVCSFGGGLVGTFDSNGVLQSGDCTKYWSLCGINPANFPTVVVKPLFGATNNTSDSGSTSENTLDVETIGACCATAGTTIILYIVPNTSNFSTLINYILSTPVTVKGNAVKPSFISISWGAPEIYFQSAELNAANTAFANAIAAGISVTVATGDSNQYSNEYEYNPKLQ